jgi:hypothetical protein
VSKDKKTPMTKNIIQPAFMLLVVVLLGCVEKDDLCCGIQAADQLSGRWLLYEVGSSPGFGYITKAIPPKPAQTLTFADNRVSSTVEGLGQFKYYEILNDTVVNTPYLALYAKDPTGQPGSPPSEGPTYSFDLAGNILTLHFRWCYEGCHMAFRKIE